MKVLLAGATGVIGRALIPQLTSAGHQVLAVSRSAQALRELESPQVQAVVADILDRDGLLRAVDGHGADAIVHHATAIKGMPKRHRDLAATDELRDVGTRNLLAAGQRLGVTRVVSQSFYLGYGWTDHGTTPLTEDAPFGQTSGGPFDRHLRSLRSNEDQVLGAGGIALRLGMFYGPEPMTYQMMRSCRRRAMPVPRSAGTAHPIHIDDAAGATVAALESDRTGQAYNIADDQPVGMDEFLDAVARAAGAPRPFRVPGALLRPMPYLHALTVATKIRLDCRKAHTELGWKPRVSTCFDGLAALALPD